MSKENILESIDIENFSYHAFYMFIETRIFGKKHSQIFLFGNPFEFNAIEWKYLSDCFSERKSMTMLSAESWPDTTDWAHANAVQNKYSMFKLVLFSRFDQRAKLFNFFSDCLG